MADLWEYEAGDRQGSHGCVTILPLAGLGSVDEGQGPSDGTERGDELLEIAHFLDATSSPRDLQERPATMCLKWPLPRTWTTT